MSYGKVARLTLRRTYETDKGEISADEQPLLLDVTISQLSEAGDDERVYTVRWENLMPPKTRTFIDRDKKTDIINVVIKSLQSLKGQIK